MLTPAQPAAWTTTLTMSTGAVSTFAGSGAASSADGTGTAASFTSPDGFAMLGGDGYVPDSNLIRKVNLSSAVVTTVAGSAGAGCMDSTNPLTSRLSPSASFVADGSSLFWIDNCSAGTGVYPVRSMDTSTGAVSTLVTPSAQHIGLTVGPSGELYSGNSAQIDKIDPTTGAITAGVATLPVPAGASGCYGGIVQSLAADATYVWATITGACPGGAPGSITWRALYRVTISTGAVTLSPGSDQILPDNAYQDPHLGVALNPGGLVSAGDYLYTVGSWQRIVRVTKSTGAMIVVAGATPGFLDNKGPDAWLNGVQGIDTDGTNLWVGDAQRVRKIVTTTAVPATQPAAWSSTTTLNDAAALPVAGNGTAGHVDGSAATAELSNPASIHVIGADGYVLEPGYLRKINLSTGAISTIAGNGGTTQWCGQAVNPLTANMNGVAPMADDGSFLYWLSSCDSFAESGVMRMSLTTGAMSRVVTRQATLGFRGLTVGPDGFLYASQNRDIEKIDPTTGQTTLLTTLPNPGGLSTALVELTADNSGLYASEHESCTTAHCDVIDKITLTGTVTTIYDSPASGASYSAPFVSAGAYLYARDDEPGWSGYVRITKSSGAVAPIMFGFLGNTAEDLAVGSGVIYLSDQDRAQIFKLIEAPSVGPNGTDAATNCGCAQNPTSIGKGSPVDMVSGAQYETADDLTVPGRGPALDFGRGYDTRFAGSAGRLGYGWSDSYDWQLSLAGSGSPVQGRATVRMGAGSTISFDPTAAGGYQPSAHVMATLVHNGSGTWTLVLHNTSTYTFDSTGKLTAITDLNGYTTTLTYSGGLLSTVTDPAGRTLTFTYDGSNRIHTVTDGLPRTVTYTYDGSGNLHTVTDADGRVWTYGYDGSHRLTTLQDPRLNTVTTHYNAAGQVDWQSDRRGKTTTFAYTETNGTGVTTMTLPRGNVETYTYLNYRLTQVVKGYGTSDAATASYGYDDTTDAVNLVTDPRGHTWSSTYDSAGNQLTSTDPLTHATTWTYNAFNEPLTMKDPLNVTTTYTYDTHGNRTSESTPLVGSSPHVDQTTTYTYGDPTHIGDVTKSTDPRGKDTVFTYDADGDVASSTDPTGRKTTYTYNAIGWRLTEVTPAGNATGGTPSQHTITYSSFTGFGQPRTVTDQLGHATTYGYDADQNLTDVTDADARHTHTDYNENNQPTLVTRPGSVTQATGYDDNGNMASQTDGLSHATTYTYDSLDRVASVTDPLSRVASYTYDVTGNRKTLVQPGTPTGSLTTTYGYDDANHQTGITYSDGVTHSVVYTYDADGQRATMVDGTGTSSYTIDSLHRLTSMTNGHGRVVGYTYDIADRVTALAYPGAGTLSRGFDDAGRLTSTTDWATTPTTNTFGYDDDGNWTAATYGNADTAARGFDRADQLTSLVYKRGTGNLGTLTYTRTNAELLNTTTPSAGAPGSTDSYTYNPRAQLTSANGTGTTWAYDAADRPTTVSGNTLAYDNADQLTTSTPTTGPATNFAYDNRGERTASTVAGAGSSTSYAYDQADNLTSYTPAGGSASIYAYDGDGLRSKKTAAGGSAQFMAWDFATGSVPLLLSDTSSTFYIYGPDSIPVEQIKAAGNTYLMGDQLGSTILLTNNTGLVKGTWTYDPYGRTTSYTGTLDTAMLYNGQYQDAESGLYYLRARYYDPNTAQFLTSDPLVRLTRDRYGYAGQDPANHVDPTGQSHGDSFGGGGEGGAGGDSGGRGAENLLDDGYGKNGTAPTSFASTGESFCDDVEADVFAAEAEAQTAAESALDRGAAKVPAEWGQGIANSKGEGTRWFDPSDNGNGIRIDEGVPGSSFPSQQVDHVIVRSGGRILGPDGKPIVGSLSENPQAHIPLSDWLNWSSWNAP